MLQKFSGKTQNVYSGVCILKGPSEKVLFHEDTEVTFDTISDEVIDAYIATKVPPDPKQKQKGFSLKEFSTFILFVTPIHQSKIFYRNIYLLIVFSGLKSSNLF